MKNIIFYLAITLLCLGCSSDDDSGNGLDDLPGSDETFVSASIGGSLFLATNMQLGLEVGAVGASISDLGVDSFFAIGISAIDFNENLTSGRILVFGLSDQNFNDVNSGYEFMDDVDEEDLNTTFVGGYGFGLVDGGEETNFEYVDGTGYFKITSIDKDAQIISGEFSYDVIDLDTDETLQITDGIFNRLEYTVQD